MTLKVLNGCENYQWHEVNVLVNTSPTPPNSALAWAGSQLTRTNISELRNKHSVEALGVPAYLRALEALAQTSRPIAEPGWQLQA